MPPRYFLRNCLFKVVTLSVLLCGDRSAYALCSDILMVNTAGKASDSSNLSAANQPSRNPVCSRCKNGARRGNLTKEPVLLQNGNMVLTDQDVLIPGRGPSLDITRVYNSQMDSRVDGWETRDGSGSWAIENKEYSGDGGESFSKNIYERGKQAFDGRGPFG